MKKYIPAILLILSSSIYATTSACPLSDKGAIQPPFGYEIGEIKAGKGYETYILKPTKENPNQSMGYTWLVSKDSQGRITKIVNGGEKPSPATISFETKKLEHEQRFQSLVKERTDRSFSLPTAQTISSAITPPSEMPIKFGGLVEMYHDADGCKVSRIADRYYDQKNKEVFEHDYFNTAKCDAIRQLHKKYYKDVAECSKAAKNHERELAALLSSSGNIGMTAGVGGGGGSPLRSIASTADFESDNLAHSIVKEIFNRNTSRLQKEKDMCDVLSPIQEKNGRQAQPAKKGSSSASQM